MTPGLCYSLECVCGYHGFAPFEGTPEPKRRIIPRARCTRCGAKGQIKHFQILYNSGAHPQTGMHGDQSRDD